MSKKTKSAIGVLKKYRADLSSVTDTKTGNTWKAKVQDSLKQYIGTDSALYSRFHNEVFTDKIQSSGGSGRVGGSVWIDTNTYTEHRYNPNRKANFERLLDEIIEHIEYHGLKETYVRTNFMSGFTNAQIIGGIVAAATIIVSLTGWLTSLSKERKIEKAETALEMAQGQNKTMNLLLHKQRDSINKTSNALTDANEKNIDLRHQIDSLIVNSQNKKHLRKDKR